MHYLFEGWQPIMDDFYVILPSNACEKVHPNNNGSKYHVTWDNSIELNGNWQVALTEIKFNHVSQSVDTRYAVGYKKKVLDYWTDENCWLRYDLKRTKFFTSKVMRNPRPAQWESWFPITAARTQYKKMLFTCANPFSIEFKSTEAANECGFDILIINSENSGDIFKIFSTNDIPEIGEIRDIKVTYASEFYTEPEYRYTSFPSELSWSTAQEMTMFMSQTMDVCFESVTYSKKKKRVEILLKNDVAEIEFKYGLHFVLGFDHSKNKPPLEASRPPQLNRGLNNLYIYASICNDIQVGDVRAPLLRSIWLDTNKRSYEFAEVQCKSVKQPMYVPINSSSINSIEVNIRSDSGNLVSFVDGAVTSITLHFKKYG